MRFKLLPHSHTTNGLKMIIKSGKHGAISSETEGNWQ
jgi:hypothetical protein